MSMTHSRLPLTVPYIRCPAVYSFVKGLRRTPSVRSSTLAGSAVPAYISTMPVGWVSSSSTLVPSAAGGTSRQKPTSVASGRTWLPSSSSSHVRERHSRKGRPSWLQTTSWPKRRDSIVG
jgi:hypothetical protein